MIIMGRKSIWMNPPLDRLLDDLKASGQETKFSRRLGEIVEEHYKNEDNLKNNTENGVYVKCHGSYEFKPISNLQEFIKVMMDVSTTEKIEENDKFSFDLLRWSETDPDWCVFACSLLPEGSKIVGGGIEDVGGIGGKYCIGENENLHSVLSELADSGWPVKIHSYFFTK